VSIIDRQLVGERPDTDGNKFIFPFRVTCEFENDGWGCSFDEVAYDMTSAAWDARPSRALQDLPAARYNYLSLAEKIWVELDSTIDEIKNYPNPDPDDIGHEDYAKALKLQGRATGLAFATMVACTPYYDSENAVLKEANRRWKMRNGQMEWAPTLGFKYSPPPAGRREVATVGGPDEPVRVNTKRADPREAKAAKLKQSDREAIKRGLESGMFKAADLAKVYGTTEDVVLFVAKA
jgi:hypothetical protein